MSSNKKNCGASSGISKAGLQAPAWSSHCKSLLYQRRWISCLGLLAALQWCTHGKWNLHLTKMWFWIEGMFANQVDFGNWPPVNIFNIFTWLIRGEVSGRMNNSVAMVTEWSAFISIRRTIEEISILFDFSITESVSSGFGCIDCRLLVKLIDFPA